jgi:hypothetical protein
MIVKSKKCKVAMLTTKKQAKLAISYSKLHKYGEYSTMISSEFVFKHLYVTSKDEIKKGDWVLYDVSAYDNPSYELYFLGKIRDTSEVGQANCHYIIEKNKSYGARCAWHCEDCKKVIATTDASLNLPTIKQSFIDKYITQYNAGNSINNVLVEYYEEIHNPKYDIWIPKLNSNNEITIKKAKNCWNEEEIIALLEKYNLDLSDDNLIDWVEKNLNY